MLKKYMLPVGAALLLLVGAAAVYLIIRQPRATGRAGFVAARGSQFLIDEQSFRFVGANVAVMYGAEERSKMPETLKQAAQDGVRVVRVWAFGEGDPESSSNNWPRENHFRSAPDEWNEETFAHLDRVIAEAARNNLRVQLCLTNWWRDTGGITQYLRWAGITDAVDEGQPYGINVERAMLFYTNERTREFYREHVRRIVTRRNTVTGVLYRDDSTIFAYELMNEAQAPAGRYDERRQWVAEMSAYIKSLDADHLVTPGTWGYRNSWERRAWLAEHRLASIDFCDVHQYPRDDLDSFVDSPQALGEFMDNRAAAAFSLDKPLVFGEFGMGLEGYQGFTEAQWFRAYFTHAARVGAAGAMFWIFTPDVNRGYGVTYTTARDNEVRAEFAQAAQNFAAAANARPPAHLLDAERHLIPRQFVFTQNKSEMEAKVIVRNEGASLIYRFAPEQAVRAQFERIGRGSGYVWGDGMGAFEYAVPARGEWRWINEIIVRARAQPVPPWDARGRLTQTTATLFINGRNCGSRLVPQNDELTQEWRVTALPLRFTAMRGQELIVKLAVTPNAEHPYGLNLTKYANFNIADRAPVEVELR